MLEAGLSPNAGRARSRGVQDRGLQRLDRRVRGVGRLEAKRAAAAGRAAERAAREQAAADRVRALAGLLAAGMTPGQAGPAAGVSKTFAYRLDRKMGGVYRPPGTTYSDRYLDREERYEIARLREGWLLGAARSRGGWAAGRLDDQPGAGPQRRPADRTGTSPSGRTGWPGSGSGGRSRPSWPATRCCGPRVQRLLDRRYSPEQVSGRLRMEHPDDPAMRVSHESIYQSIYVYPRGELRRELKSLPAVRAGRSAGAAAAARPAARSSARSRSASGPPRSRAAWSPATTKET